MSARTTQDTETGAAHSTAWRLRTEKPSSVDVTRSMYTLPSVTVAFTTNTMAARLESFHPLCNSAHAVRPGSGRRHWIRDALESLGNQPEREP